jgi:two-component system, NtrC family, response regulator PilR
VLPAASATGLGARSRILVAEDDAAFRRLLEMVLARDGYAVTTLATGTALRAELEAVDRGAEPPALVLSDHCMPGGTGLDAFEEARRRGSSVPFVLVTASFDDEVAARARRAGVIVLTKPVDLHDLRAAVRTLAAPLEAAPGAYL